MPIYDYRCDHCGHAFSAVQSFTDSTIEKCPNCGKKPRKLLVVPAVVFKGSGWYKTDSRGKAPSEDGSAPAKSDTRSDAKSETKSETTSETKSDAKADTKSTGEAKPAKSEAKS